MTDAPLRIALREEGDWWMAYVARPGTMEGALPIASIRMAIVRQSIEHKEAFIELMKDIIEDILTGQGVVIEDWSEPQDAPESERSGHA